MSLRSFVLVPLLCAGCTWADGNGWANLSAEVRAHLHVDAPQAAEYATLRTDLGHDVRVDRLVLLVDGLTLYRVGGGGAAPAAFDPANPPPGYGLCHGGHCHAPSGGTESYEEIAAKLASGTISDADVAWSQLGGELRLDALDGHPAELPPRTLGAVELASAAPRVSGLELRGGFGPGGETALTVQLDLDAPVPVRAGSGEVHNLPVSIGPDGPSEVGLGVEIEVPGTLLDELSLDGLPEHDGVRTLRSQDGPADAITLLHARLSALHVQVVRAEGSSHEHEAEQEHEREAEHEHE